MRTHVSHRAVLALTLLVCASLSAPTLSQAASLAITSNGVLAFTNAERYKRGLDFLKVDAKLSEVAERKMRDLFARQYFAHEAPTGESVGDLAKDAGYEYLTVGENLALGDFASNIAVVDAWMNSKGHRANILSPKYTEIGIAAGRSVYEGRNAWIIVQSFGLPRSSCPALNTELKAQITAEGRTLEAIRTIAELREAQLEEKGVSRAVQKARVDAYNRAAEVYNERAKKYRALVASYNKSVDKVNTCIEQKFDD